MLFDSAYPTASSQPFALAGAVKYSRWSFPFCFQWFTSSLGHKGITSCKPSQVYNTEYNFFEFLRGSSCRSLASWPTTTISRWAGHVQTSTWQWEDSSPQVCFLMTLFPWSGGQSGNGFLVSISACVLNVWEVMAKGCHELIVKTLKSWAAAVAVAFVVF